ncbi:MAG: hypothetical protein LBH08_01280 [Puniceicoccales bacterium]|nr:hypothetical protein [Puniceicoccales bacterium]
MKTIFATVCFVLVESHVASSEQSSAIFDVAGAKGIYKISPMASGPIKIGGTMYVELETDGQESSNSTEEMGDTLSLLKSVATENQRTSLQTSLAVPSEVDLSKEDVLFPKVVEAIDFVLNPENANAISRFLFGRAENPIDKIAKNSDLQNKLQRIKAKLEKICNQNQSEDKAAYLKKLRKLGLLFQEVSDLLQKEKFIGAFPQFIQGVAESISVIIVNDIAEDVLQRLKSKIEEKLRNTSDVTSLSGGVFVHSPKIANFPGMYAGGGVHATSRKTYGDSTLFQTSKGGGISMTGGLGSRVDSGFKAKIGLDVLATTMYTSVEQFIDSNGLANFGDAMSKAKKCLVETLNTHKRTQSISQILTANNDLKTMGDEVSSSRHELQRSETRGLLATRSIEIFLRMLGIVPRNVHIKLPHITGTELPMTKTSVQVKATLSAELSCIFDKMGLEVSASSTYSTTRAPRHYLALLNSDCSPIASWNAEDVEAAIGANKGYDHSEKYLSAIDNVPVADAVKGFMFHLSAYNDVLKELAQYEEKKSDIKQLGSDISELKKKIEQFKKSQRKKKGDGKGVKKDITALDKQLEDLNKKLKGLENECKQNEVAQNEQKVRKRTYESQLSPKFFFRSEGRLGVLKSSIVTFAKFRERAKTAQDLQSFEDAYQQLKTLESLLKFSKNKDSQSGAVMQKAESGSISKEISGMAYIGGGCSVSLRGKECSGSPFLSENRKSLTLEVDVPLSSLGGLQAIRGWVESKRTKLKGDESNSEEDSDSSDQESSRAIIIAKSAIRGHIANITHDVSYAANVGRGVIDGTNPQPKQGSGLLGHVANEIGMDKILEKAGEVAGIVSRQIPCRKIRAQFAYVEPHVLTEGVEHLPGKSSLISRNDSTWVTLYTESLLTKKLEKTVEVGAFLGAVKVGMSRETQVGDKTQTFGTDTMIHIASEFDKAQRGNLSTWNALKKAHSKELAKMLKNLVKDDSVILYELQGLYNDNLKNIGADAKLKKECSGIFRELLDNCEKYSQNNSHFQSAIDSLEKVLKFNYDHNSLVHFNRAFAPKEKSKSKTKR